jgi:PAS domain S-box-containing protein
MYRTMLEPDYKAIFENLPGLYLVLDRDLRIVAASDAYLQATFTDRAAVAGRFLFDVFPDNPDDPSADAVRNTRASLNRALRSRVPDSMAAQRHAVRRPQAEGGGFEARYWRATHSPILAADGSVTYIIRRVEDVTDFVLLKGQGREHEPHVVESSSDGPEGQGGAAGQHAQPESAPRAFPVPKDVEAPHILIVEDHPEMSAFLAETLGRHYWISQAFSGREGVDKALQSDRPDLIIADVTVPDMTGAALVEELRRHSELDDVPVVMLTAKADHALRVQLLRQGVQDYLDKPVSVDELLARVQSLLGMWKRAGQRLRQSEERYRTLFNSVDEGFCIIEMVFDESDKAIDYVFLETNPAFEAQTGLHDVQGKHIRELAPEIEDHWLDIYGKVALTGEPVRFESHAEHLRRWFDTYAFRYGDRENRQVAVLLKDITQRRGTERALQEADRRKDRFLALLAHELRNPLAPIRNAVEILRMSPAAQTPPGSQLLPMMERQLAHMARLLDDLLDVSLIANGMIELRKERIDVAQAVMAGVEASQPLIDSMGHHLSVSLPPRSVQLDADPVRLAQVVSNLLNNAAHYSMRGGRIHLSVELEGPEVRLAVRDTGAGIRSQDLERIFGLFVQVGPPSARRQGGLGVGLSLVLTMVELHGGKVEARSGGPGQGSEFIVRLPAAHGWVQESFSQS